MDLNLEACISLEKFAARGNIHFYPIKGMQTDVAFCTSQREGFGPARERRRREETVGDARISRRSTEGWNLELDVVDGIVPTGFEPLSATAKRWKQAPIAGAREAKQNAADDPVRAASIIAASMPIRITEVACARA